MEGAGVLEYGMRGLCNTASALPTTCFSVTAQQQEEDQMIRLAGVCISMILILPLESFQYLMHCVNCG